MHNPLLPDLKGMEMPYLRYDGGLIIYSVKIGGRYVLYWSAVIKKEWQKPAPVFHETPVNESHLFPFLSSDGKKLYFTSVNIQTGESRIMVSELDNGRFRTRKILDAPVNSGYGESAFIISPIGDGAFVSSKRPGGLGGWDIWFIPVIDGKFGIPINPGPPVNSESDEAEMESAGGSVYRFRTWRRGYPEYCSIAEPDLSYTVRLKITDAGSSEPLQVPVRIAAGKGTSYEGIPFAGIVLQTDNEGRVAFRVHYSVREAQISVNTPGYLPWSGTAEIQKYITQEFTAGLTPIRKHASFSVRSVQFAYNSAEISEESNAVLDSFAEHLLQNPDVRYEIIGHTDLKGSHAFNNKLSKARADAVRNYLIKKGIAPERLVAVGKGKTEPVKNERSPEADLLNRRTEFRVISGD